MGIKINDETKSSAILCKHEFACLSSTNHVLCKVNDCINEKVHFIECKDQNYCAYQKSCGYSHVCNCPARKETYNKYKI
jgi:hypothetical protein